MREAQPDDMSNDQDSRIMAAATASNSNSAPPLTEANLHSIPPILPHGRVFPIQIGDELFKLSGASLCSDSPSYFSQYFRKQLDEAEARGEDGDAAAVKTLYIDRDPGTFRDISMHLQGYHVKPKDAAHFVKLFADAQFYSLPKFISQLYEENIFVTIGGREFQIPRDVFNDPGNHPNYFSLGFAIFFSRPDDLFPGLSREGLMRPPSILPPAVPNRDPDTFADLLRMLRGYPLRIRNEQHREDLLKDAKYFHFKGLEQRIIAHQISYNQSREKEEIALRLENVQKSGISVEFDATGGGWVRYARPFVDDKPREMILEIGQSATKLHFSGGQAKAEFFRETRTRITRLFEVIAAKLNLPATTQPLGRLIDSGGAGSQPATPGDTALSEDLVSVMFDNETAVTLDGKPLYGKHVPGMLHAGEWQPSDNPRKRQRMADLDLEDNGNPRVESQVEQGEWVVRKGLWRLRLVHSQGGKSAVVCQLSAVKIDAESCEQAHNFSRDFL